MNIIELCEDMKILKTGDNILYDEGGNCYIYNPKWNSLEAIEECILELVVKDIYEEFIILTPEEQKELQRINIELSPDLYTWRVPIGRAGTALRGKPVTEEQAFNIISRTDEYFRYKDREEDLVYTSTISNSLISYGYGWINKNGELGIDSYTHEYPNIGIIISDAYELLYNFPYLNLVIAYTDYEEERDTSLKAFYRSIKLVVHLQENNIKVLTGSEAVKLYKKYAKQYEYKNKFKELDKEYREKLKQQR